MTIIKAHLSSGEWEQDIGAQVRRVRIATGLDQTQLAERAAVSIGAVRNLERGNGSTVKTLVQVMRALGREDWLGSIAPAVSVSPLEVYRNGSRSRSRVYRPRSIGRD
jgi:transcriptional regulator with XRE-family HTH domain